MKILDINMEWWKIILTVDIEDIIYYFKEIDGKDDSWN